MSDDRDKHPAAGEAAQDEDQAAASAPEAECGTSVPDSPPGDLCPPAELAARAEQMASQAAAGRTFAGERRDQAQALMAAARAEAAAIIGEAEARSRELGQEADRREREAHGLADRARWLGHAATVQEQAITAAVLATSLADEREHLAAQMAELDGTLAQLGAGKQDAEAQLAAARGGADVTRAEAQESRLKALEGVIATQTAQRAAAQSSLTALGDGTASFPGQLADALRAVQAHQAEVRKILNLTFPDRPEARLDAARAELQAAIEGNLARITEEAQAKPPQRQIVRL